MEERIGREAQGIGLLDERAGETGDDEGVGGWIGFGVVGVRETGDIAGKFDQGVLETAAGAEEGAAGFAGEADGGEGAGFVFVGAGRDEPHGGERGEVARGVGEIAGGDPLPGETGGGRRGGAGEAERERNRAVGGDGRVGITCEGGCGHAAGGASGAEISAVRRIWLSAE